MGVVVTDFGLVRRHTPQPSTPLLAPPCRTHSLPTDISFGTIGSAGAVTAQASGAPQYAILASPTPGRDNSGPRPGGPLIVG